MANRKIDLIAFAKHQDAISGGIVDIIINQSDNSFEFQQAVTQTLCEFFVVTMIAKVSDGAMSVDDVLNIAAAPWVDRIVEGVYQRTSREMSKVIVERN